MKKLLALLALAPVTALAVPVSYDEAIDGDLDVGSTTFELDFGSNTIAGTVSGTTTDLGLDFDFFNLAFPDSSVIQSITLNLTNSEFGNGLFVNEFQGSGDFGAFTFFEFVSDGGFFDFTDLVTQINDSGLSELEFVGFNGIPFPAANDYLITIDIGSTAVSVPAPAALSLLGLGLAGLGFARRRVPS